MRKDTPSARKAFGRIVERDTTFQLLMAEAVNDAYNLAYALLLPTRGWGTGLIGAALLIVWFLKLAHHFSYYHNDLSR